MKHLAICAAACVLAAAVLTAHTPQQTPPPQDPQQPAATFRSAVDLVPVDVNIIDKTGHPVTGLEAGDFVLTIDGKPRKVATAQYIAAGRETDRPAVPLHYSSNLAAEGGRLIMIVVDQGNIGAGRGKLVLEAASRFVANLNPADRVAVVAIPGAGPQMEFTSNHAVVKSVLPKLIGIAAPVEGTHRVGISEAIELQRGDQFVLGELLDRECAGYREPQELALCTRQVQADANAVFQTARERTRNSLVALRYLIERLAATPSEGLVLDRDFSEVTWLGPAAARGQVVLYVLQLDQPQFDASARSVSPTRNRDISLQEEGLDMLAGRTRGSVLRVVSNPDAAFGRLGLELSAYYLLSFEPEPGDRDGKPHKIRIDVPGRKGVEIRARSEFTVDPPRAVTDETMLADALRAPLLLTEVGLKVSTYTLRDPATGKPRVLLAADIDRSLNPSGRVALAFALLDARGKVVASQIDANVAAPIRLDTKAQTFVASAVVESPGVHTLKIAVVTEQGKRGTVEHTFEAKLFSAGQVRATDLLIAENPGGAERNLAPAVSADFTSDVLHGYLELYSDSVEVLQQTSVVIEVASNDQARPLDAVVARLQPPVPETPNRRTAEGSVPIALLPAGEYVARAIININGRKAGQVTRPFRIARSGPMVTAPGEGGKTAAGSTTPIAFASRIDRFDRASVLAPQVVGFFIDRMNFGTAGVGTLGPAIESARAGRFEDVLAKLEGGQNNPLVVAFLSGLALYSQGQLNPAMEKFRETIRLDPEFFPAAFYLGSCYAAAGKDRDAVGAWQTSLITEGDAPFIYTLLGDALLRLREIGQAEDILKEAASIWPDNDQVQLRYGTVLAMAGKQMEAVERLEPYLAKHPDDQERLFVVLRAIYEARAAGKSIKSAADDRATFAKYAAAYAAAGGPQQALVDEWKKFIDKH
jgi:VWFA-related protein